MVAHNEVIFGDLNQQMNEWSMVAIRDSFHNNDCFPPINHENLQIPSNQQQQKQKQPDDYKPGPQLPSPSDSRLPIKWLGIGFDVVRAKIVRIASPFVGYDDNNNNDGAIRGTFWSFLPAAGMAVTVMLWWLCRRRGRMSMDRWMLVIKERDEKIIQLLQQIVQMNEVLLAHHKVSASKLAN